MKLIMKHVDNGVNLGQTLFVNLNKKLKNQSIFEIKDNFMDKVNYTLMKLSELRNTSAFL